MPSKRPGGRSSAGSSGSSRDRAVANGFDELAVHFEATVLIASIGEPGQVG
ncbi:hypothetical protein [Streptomyces hydrogenans]|uniref:hypothetical protein n=1 Tax=Streptomyces hydrogenans TaxID=1873719 RepID=UPI0035E1ADD6